MPSQFILKFANLKNFVLELTQLLGKLKYSRLNFLTLLHELHLYLKRQMNNRFAYLYIFVLKSLINATVSTCILCTHSFIQ